MVVGLAALLLGHPEKGPVPHHLGVVQPAGDGRLPRGPPRPVPCGRSLGFTRGAGALSRVREQRPGRTARRRAHACKVGRVRCAEQAQQAPGRHAHAPSESKPPIGSETGFPSIVMTFTACASTRMKLRACPSAAHSRWAARSGGVTGARGCGRGAPAHRVQQLAGL